MSSWAEDCVEHNAAEGEERFVRRAVRETIVEAARRCQQLADESMALEKADGTHPDSRRALHAYGYLNGCLFAKEFIEAMLEPEVKR